MKVFLESDVKPHGAVAGAGHIITENYQKELLLARPECMRRGLQETASGYGAKLNSGYMINFCGKLYRVYTTCHSNSGSCWFMVRGRKIFVS